MEAEGALRWMCSAFLDTHESRKRDSGREAW
jgi:hypothetical protein